SVLFSTRRRHTRFSRDWSPDVCSSDLPASSLPLAQQPLTGSLTVSAHLTEEAEPVPTGLVWRVFAPERDESGKLPLVATAEGGEIGRASSRRGGGLQRSGISGH